MELRNVKITIQQAANWYSSNNDTLKALALSAFSRDELILYYIKAQSKTVSLDLPLGQIDKFKTLAQLMNIARYYNKDWEPHWKDLNETKYYIRYINSFNDTPAYEVDWNQGTTPTGICFKNKEDAQSVINNPNFRIILNTVFGA